MMNAMKAVASLLALIAAAGYLGMTASGCTDKFTKEPIDCAPFSVDAEFDRVELGHCVFKAKVSGKECLVNSVTISGVSGETDLQYRKDEGAWITAEKPFSDPHDTGDSFKTTSEDAVNGTYEVKLGSGDEVMGATECRAKTIKLQFN